MTAPAPGIVLRDGAPHSWTGSGYLNLLDPDPAAFTLADVARNLSRLGRYAGATRRFYSVGEHSLYCADLAAGFVALGEDPDLEVWALMHDAAEAFVGDLIRPCKLAVPEFEALEGRVWRAVARKWSLPEVPPRMVKHCDNLAAAAEKRDLVTDPSDWPGLPPPPVARIPAARGPVTWEVEAWFFTRAKRLGLR